MSALMSWMDTQAAQHRRAAAKADKLLHGTSAAMLPIEQSNTFEVLVSLKTGRALGMNLPPHGAAYVTEWMQ